MRTSKKGFTLIEMVASLPLISLVVIAGVMAYVVGYGGFKSGAGDYAGSMQASLLKEVFDESIPNAQVINFTSPTDGCNAIIFEDGKAVYIQGYNTSSEKRFVVDSVQDLAFHVEQVGDRCSLSYTITVSNDGGTREYKGAVMLLNVSEAEFLAENDIMSLPADFSFTATSTSFSLYIVPKDSGGGSDQPTTDPNAYQNISYMFKGTKDPNSSHFEYTLTLTNNSSEPVRGWIIEFDYPGTLDSSYNSTFESLGNHHYRITSNGGNDQNSCISVGGKQSATGHGSYYAGDIISNVIIKRVYDLTKTNVTMKLKIVSSWGQGTSWGGFNYTITLTNNGTQPIMGWVLEFTYDGDLDPASVYNATLESLGNHRYRFTNSPHTMVTIYPNQSIDNFGGGGTNQGTTVSNATLNGVSITVG